MTLRIKSQLFLVVFCLVSCTQVAGEGSVTGWLTIEECGPSRSLIRRCEAESDNAPCSAFDLSTDFYALELFDERSGKLRLQRGGAALQLTDALVLEFKDIRDLRGRLGEPLPIGQEHSIRAALILGQSCPESTESLTLTGELVMTHFGTEVGDRIAGQIAFIEVRDGRDSLRGLLGVLQGYFDFRYRKGTPFEQFYR